MDHTIKMNRYGDYGDREAAGGQQESKANANEWPLWEIFIRSKQGLDHKHVGSLHAADAQMAIENARECIHPPHGRGEHMGGGEQTHPRQQSR